MIVLIVEDELNTGFDLADELERAGHLVMGPVPNSAEALRLAENWRPDLVVLGIELAGEYAGLGLAHQLASMHIQCLYWSARSELAYENKRDALGYLAKPYNFEDVPEVFSVLEDVIYGISPRTVKTPSILELFESA